MKTFTVVGALVAAFWVFPSGASALSPMHVQARSAMLVDLTDGHVLYEQDADTPIPPASLTKVLTLYLVHEAIEEGRLNPEDMVTVSRRAASRGGSRMGLRAGEKVPVTELIKGMAVASGNDACVAIAEYLCGSVEQFVGLMNRKAAELGMRRTVFQTADGLPADGQFTTARDMAKLAAAYLRRFPYALGVHSMQSYTYGRSTHRNANRLLGTCPGVDGLKTGFVCASGYNFIATANRGDHRLVAVVLGARSPGVRATETAKLINQGYASLNIETPPIYAAMKPQPNQMISTHQKTSSRTKVFSEKSAKKPIKTAVAPATPLKAEKITSSRTGIGRSGELSGKANLSGRSKPAVPTSVKASAAEKTATKASLSASGRAAPTGRKEASRSKVMASGPAAGTSGKAVSGKGKTTAKTATNFSDNKVQANKSPSTNEVPSGKKKQASAMAEKQKSTQKQKILSPPAARKTATSPRPS
ncbi:MAG: serine hydrolase [Desulfosoma sp.]